MCAVCFSSNENQNAHLSTLARCGSVWICVAAFALQRDSTPYLPLPLLCIWCKWVHMEMELPRKEWERSEQWSYRRNMLAHIFSVRCMLSICAKSVALRPRRKEKRNQNKRNRRKMRQKQTTANTHAQRIHIEWSETACAHSSRCCFVAKFRTMNWCSVWVRMCSKIECGLREPVQSGFLFLGHRQHKHHGEHRLCWTQRLWWWWRQQRPRQWQQWRTRRSWVNWDERQQNKVNECCKNSRHHRVRYRNERRSMKRKLKLMIIARYVHDICVVVVVAWQWYWCPPSRYHVVVVIIVILIRTHSLRLYMTLTTEHVST